MAIPSWPFWCWLVVSVQVSTAIWVLVFVASFDLVEQHEDFKRFGIVKASCLMHSHTDHPLDLKTWVVHFDANWFVNLCIVRCMGTKESVRHILLQDQVKGGFCPARPVSPVISTHSRRGRSACFIYQGRYQSSTAATGTRAGRAAQHCNGLVDHRSNSNSSVISRTFDKRDYHWLVQTRQHGKQLSTPVASQVLWPES